MPCYDNIDGKLCEVKEIYDNVNGVLQPVMEAYDNIDGKLNKYYTKGELGSETNPFKISTCEDWVDFANNVNFNRTYTDSKGNICYYNKACYKLTNDLDFSSYCVEKYVPSVGTKGFTNSGGKYINLLQPSFSGILDGANHRISNIACATPIAVSTSDTNDSNNSYAFPDGSYAFCGENFALGRKRDSNPASADTGSVFGTIVSAMIKNLIIDNLKSNIDDISGTTSKSIFAYRINGSTVQNVKLKGTTIYAYITDEVYHYNDINVPDEFAMFSIFIEYSTIEDCLIDRTCEITCINNKIERSTYDCNNGFRPRLLAYKIWSKSDRPTSILRCAINAQITYGRYYQGESNYYPRYSDCMSIFYEDIDGGYVIIKDCKIYPFIHCIIDVWVYNTSNSAHEHLWIILDSSLTESSSYADTNDTNNILMIEDDIKLEYSTQFNNDFFSSLHYHIIGPGIYSANPITQADRTAPAQNGRVVMSRVQNKFCIERESTDKTSDEAKSESFVATLNANTTDNPWEYVPGNYPMLPCEL